MSIISGITTFMHDTSTAVNRLSNTLNSVVDQLATLQIQMSAVREVNTQLKSNITIIEEKLKKMQSQIDTKPTPTFASVAGSGLPPRPNVDMPPPGKPNGQTLQGKNAKKEKLIQALYPKAAREVIVSFADADKLDLTKEVADKALTEVNSAFLNSDLKKRPFHGARFSIAKNLILTTALHETSADLEIYWSIITEALKFIGPAVAKISEPWTKFILHGVPTYLELEEIHRDVED
jgi:hypothetical protein